MVVLLSQILYTNYTYALVITAIEFAVNDLNIRGHEQRLTFYIWII